MKYGGLKFRIPGTSWCGPFWSDNTWKPNSCGYATARSRADQTCKEHDCDIHRGVPYAKADWNFARKNNFNPIALAPLIYHGIKRERSNSGKEMPPVKKLNNYQDYLTPPMSQRRSSVSSVGSRSLSNMSFASSRGRSAFAATSGYAGPLNRKGKKSGRTNYITNQYSSYDGQSGTAPNTSNAYLIAHSFPIWNVIAQVLSAILVKALRNKGQDITKTTDTFAFIPAVTNWVLRIYYFNDTNQFNDINITNLNQILYAGSVLVDTIRGFSVGSVDKPPRLQLTRLEIIEPTGEKYLAVNLRNTYIHTMTSLNIRVQNQTTAEGGGNETTDIDANPLEGRIYDVNSSYIVGRGRASELDIPFPSRLPNTSFVSEIVGLSDYAFAKTNEILNCKKVSSVQFPPGAIKNTYLKANFEGFLNNLISKALPDETSGTPGNFKPPIHHIGYGIVLAVRKLMRDNTAGITLAWDTQYNISTKVSMKFPAFGVAQPSFSGTPTA